MNIFSLFKRNCVVEEGDLEEECDTFPERIGDVEDKRWRRDIGIIGISRIGIGLFLTVCGAIYLSVTHTGTLLMFNTFSVIGGMCVFATGVFGIAAVMNPKATRLFSIYFWLDIIGILVVPVTCVMAWAAILESRKACFCQPKDHLKMNVDDFSSDIHTTLMETSIKEHKLSEASSTIYPCFFFGLNIFFVVILSVEIFLLRCIYFKRSNGLLMKRRRAMRTQPLPSHSIIREYRLPVYNEECTHFVNGVHLSEVAIQGCVVPQNPYQATVCDVDRGSLPFSAVPPTYEDIFASGPPPYEHAVLDESQT